MSIQERSETVDTSEQVPQPSKPPKRENSESPAYVILQIVEARGLRAVDGSENKTNPTAFIFRREILDDGKGEKLFSTSEKKKTLAPQWNERFQINVTDAESEIVVIRFGNGAKGSSVLKGKNFLGEISFPLRGSVRGDFDTPKYQFRWFPITGKQEKCPDPTGEVKIFIQYVDTRAMGKPTDFQQVSHIGWDPDGGFDIKNIPQEWKSLFKKANIKKKDLEDNPELQRQVLTIMQQAQGDAEALGTQVSSSQFVPVVNAPPPPPPPSGGGGPKAPPPPPSGGGGPKAPPPPSPGLKAPPPPPSGGGGQDMGGDDGGGGGRGGLLDQIKMGTSLKKVDINESRKSEAPESGGTLLSTLQNALMMHRGAIEGDDEEGGDEEWSNDWSDEDK